MDIEANKEVFKLYMDLLDILAGVTGIAQKSNI